MKQIVYDLKTKETKIIELPDPTPEEVAEMENQLNEEINTDTLPSDSERIKILEEALLELAEVIANG